MKRKVSITNPQTNETKVIETAATTWGEIAKEAGYPVCDDNIKFMNGTTGTSLKTAETHIPNDQDIKIFMSSTQRITSGNDC